MTIGSLCPWILVHHYSDHSFTYLANRLLTSEGTWPGLKIHISFRILPSRQNINVALPFMWGQGSLWNLGGMINTCWPKLASDLNWRHRRVRWIDRMKSLATIMSKGKDSNDSARHCGSMSGLYSRMLMNKWHTTQITTNSATFNIQACTELNKFSLLVSMFRICSCLITLQFCRAVTLLL